MLKYCTILSLYLFVIALNTQSQNATIDIRYPRTKENANANGHYELSVTVDKSQVNRGDSVIIELYITGYGQIKQPKVFVLSTSKIFDETYVRSDLYGFGRTPTSTSTNYTDWEWGGQEKLVKGFPIYIEWSAGFKGNIKDPFSGLISDSVYNSGSFVDILNEPSTTRIMTEMYKNNAPMTLSLPVRKKARPDNYKLNFYFTYFNGIEWTGSTATVDLRVNSRFEEYEDWVIGLGLLFAFFGIFPVIGGIYKYWNKTFVPFLKRKLQSLKPSKKMTVNKKPR